MPELDARVLPRLVALTGQARAALEGAEVAIDHVPFKVGREGRLMRTRRFVPVERRVGRAPHVNDLYLRERPAGYFLHISREHFLIDRDHHAFYLVDRGSVCGTIVGNQTIGGDGAGGRAQLRDQEVLIVGTASSPFVFMLRFD